ncbi:glycosyltransferase family 2 protein [Cryobacterium sp. TMS1-13-1]|uniref:glycosyltransferase n=1 Tax=Cryobacterium sp. TMS1-13-1 TaxID=1259220 RepID=UPI00106A3B4C|nr:glycosyltransferase family 2 protein [Cryobacterium sp. TMS1-13-1]TFD23053.1 glycosyltransferase family 2 protein [Cryobacterium sp. TMS1-13-1]
MSVQTSRSSPEFVTIVVPVRNEEVLLPRALAALAVAIDALAVLPQPDRPAVSVLLVLDQCTDLSARVAALWPDFDRVEIEAGAVGVARRFGVQRALRRLEAVSASGVAASAVGDGQAERIWIASTDADSAVPPNWLITQLAFARNGVDLVLGTVQPDDELAAHELVHWESLHRIGEGHPHVHGANLGVRADRYLAAGEFAPVDRDEDRLLVAALRELGVAEARTALIPVLTSGRRVGRAPAGFAEYLREHINPDWADTEAVH